MKVEASVPAIGVAPKEALPRRDLGLHKHTFIIVAIALLVAGVATIRLGANYWTAKTIPVSDNVTIKTSGKPVSGFNLTVPAAGFQAKLQQITSQPATLTVGTYSEQVSTDTIKSWLQITTNKSKSEYYIHVNQAAIADSLTKEAGQYTRAPVNQVTINEDGVNRAVTGGRDGRQLSDPGTLKIQAQQAAKNVLAGKGLQFNTPLTSQPFQAVTPVAFNKLIVVNTTAKKMWLFENGQQVQTFLVSAGKPSTPTPIGQFHIYSKLAVQDMRGLNTDGTPYFQPHVYWVNYFSGGNAIHGVYWHPLSWFGAINSSHGCVGIPDDEAQWVYNWAPIGTTVIVHV